MSAKKWMISVFVIATLAMSGCSTEVGNAQAAEAGEANVPVETIEIVAETSDQEKESAIKVVEDEAPAAAANSMIMGKVVSVYGNYIQIDKIQMPERAGGNRQSGEASDNKNQTSLVSTSVPGAGGGGGSRPPGGPGGNAAGAEYESSGEIIDIMIPVGAEIKSLSNDALELTYENINKGMIIKINVDQTMTDEVQDSSEVDTFYADNVLIVE